MTKRNAKNGTYLECVLKFSFRYDSRSSGRTSGKIKRKIQYYSNLVVIVVVVVCFTENPHKCVSNGCIFAAFKCFFSRKRGGNQRMIAFRLLASQYS